MQKVNFEQIWDEYIIPLKGKTLRGYRGQVNKIVDVGISGVTRISKNGLSSTISKQVFKGVVDVLITEGKITRLEINATYPIRASSAIVLILSQVPLFSLVGNPLTLVYDRHK